MTEPKSKTLRFVPRWRNTKEPIELITHPTAEWFAELKCRHARFVVSATGDIYWGDAYTVVHQDIMSVGRGHHLGAKTCGLLAGVVKLWESDPRWTVVNTQFFANGTTCGKIEQSFLRSNVAWQRVEKMLGRLRWLDSYGEELGVPVPAEECELRECHDPQVSPVYAIVTHEGMVVKAEVRICRKHYDMVASGNAPNVSITCKDDLGR